MNKKKIRWQQMLLEFLKYAFLVLFCIVVIYPVLYAVLGSFKSNYEVTLGGTLLPKEWVFTNYQEALEQFDFLKYAVNSLFLSAVTTGTSILICALAAYCFARKEFIGKALLENIILATMFVTVGTVTLRPIYQLMVKINMHNSLLPVVFIIIAANLGTYVFLISKFIKGVPVQLDEAATIDGAGEFRIFFQIILPLIKPVLGVVGLFSFRSAWNDYINSNIFTMTRPDLKTLTVGVVSLKNGLQAAAQWNIMLAGAAMSIIPMLIVYILTNKTFISGLTDGGVKG